MTPSIKLPTNQQITPKMTTSSITATSDQRPHLLFTVFPQGQNGGSQFHKPEVAPPVITHRGRMINQTAVTTDPTKSPK